jgi:23S rRNA (cytosine1962-C5)-methyltransferase
MPEPKASRFKLILFEDEHLLVVNKPAGWNTHAPSPFAGEGVYDWLRHREPRWATLAIIHRLDRETSGVLVFAKSREANRSLTAQFTEHSVSKSYLLVTDRPVKRRQFTVVSALVRAGERYRSNPAGTSGEQAETRFRVRETAAGRTWVEAEPITGRTHQIRVHAAESGFPVLGDALYGGTAAPRVHLHAAELTLRHPATGGRITFAAPADFEADARLPLREAVIDPAETNAFRLIHGAADGWPGWHVDQLGEFLLSQSEKPLTVPQLDRLRSLLDATRNTQHAARGVCHKILNPDVRKVSPAEAAPQRLLGDAAPERFEIRENGLRFELSFSEGYSVGLFLDQRDNRRRFLTGHIAAGFPLWTRSAGLRSGAPQVLNTFAYTCGFSVCAAKAGAHTTSLDLSKKYLEWGRMNFALNRLDAARHEFIFGDTFDWLRRLAKKGRMFDAVALDPPTFSQSKARGMFRAEKDYGRLVATALPVLRPDGALFASTNAATLRPEEFLRQIESAVESAGRRILQRHYAPQPPDFPITRETPGYLKTVWMRIGGLE